MNCSWKKRKLLSQTLRLTSIILALATVLVMSLCNVLPLPNTFTWMLAIAVIAGTFALIPHLNSTRHLFKKYLIQRN
ncbi:hypothetical protein MUN88_19775 [Gracilibacillus caseinilyticus]|uniref:Uncharacterized protein n=1 Tax=Gracilibacillus caseinilyticus TaxID=2932256 RepID=A0ABY4EV16_9BACI|nr:hypothetical protein [Gracilibacillus caseinilyticus]UOQ48249.1 hypothetical protein MUN88_19775 [Gracilibacillus caseinilyticus]